MEGATDKFLMGAVTFAADLEREKAKQRTSDAMLRKAKAGHVTGGDGSVTTMWTCGMPPGSVPTSNTASMPLRLTWCGGIFQLCAEGMGQSRIAKLLNAERAVTPQSEQGRPKGWAPSSVRVVLHRELYRGVIVYNKNRKRDMWGQSSKRIALWANGSKCPTRTCGSCRKVNGAQPMND